MAEKANKVKFNLKNTHYALLTISEDGTPTFGVPVPMPGSVSISLDANGEPENFYADGGVYYVINNNCGYDGDLELALIPESFRTDVLKETLDSKGVLIENSEVELAADRADPGELPHGHHARGTGWQRCACGERQCGTGAFRIPVRV